MINNQQSESTHCPSCNQFMTRLELPQRGVGNVALDLCFPCQGIWFDQFESGQITPGGVVDLFKLIHAHRDDLRQPISATLKCPRCEDRLLKGQDVARSGRFTYQRCLQNHGRFTIFGQFMIEKGFVRQLAPAEIKALAARLGTVHCTGCGAAIDIRSEAACSHCAAPIAILDPEAVENALANYQRQETQRTHLDPEALADAVIAAEKSRNKLAKSDSETHIGDLLLSGIGVALNLFDL